MCGGLIKEMDDGRYKITIQKQFGVLLSLGSIGRFVTLDLLDRISNLGTALSTNADKMTKRERNRYTQFHKSELRKVDQLQRKQGKNDNNEKDVV